MAYKKYDLAGKKFNKLLAIRNIGNMGTTGGNYWECMCDCGNLTNVRTAYLINGRKASCGCFRKELSRESIKKLQNSSKLPYGEASRNKLFGNYKSDAKKRGHDFSISMDYFLNITQKDCNYCGTPPIYEYGDKLRNNGPYICNGIDRLDSNLGYYEKNIVPCCKICNYMKNTLTVEEFIKHIFKISKFVKERNK